MSAETAPTASDVLKAALGSAHSIAGRLAWSSARVRHLMPLDAASMQTLDDEEVERLDAYLQRFGSLTAFIQDQVTKALLRAEEEDLSEKSRKDQRLLLEKVGALRPELQFGAIAELRNKVAHMYPDEPAKQAEILNLAYLRGIDLIAVFNDLLDYADAKFFASALDLEHAVVLEDHRAEP